MATPLSDKMRALADGGHARAKELRARADEFDAAAAGFGTAPRTFLGAVGASTKALARMHGRVARLNLALFAFLAVFTIACDVADLIALAHS